jgi:LysM repeat protein
MSSVFPSLLAAALLAAPVVASAEQPRDYDAVRRIALRDPKVQDAFARANQRLDERIVQIDPSQAAFVRTHPSGRSASAAAEPKKPEAKKPEAKKPEARKAPAPAPSAAQKTHTVKAGETLSSISAQYGVSPQYLQGANHIRDERKLKVGQVLVIPVKK